MAIVSVIAIGAFVPSWQTIEIHFTGREANAHVSIQKERAILSQLPDQKKRRGQVSP